MPAKGFDADRGSGHEIQRLHRLWLFREAGARISAVHAILIVK